MIADQLNMFGPPPMPACEVCATPLTTAARANARYCSTTCRTRAHRRNHRSDL